MNNSLKLFINDLNNKKFMQIFKGYTFALTLLKINCNKYVESIKEISNGFMKEFIVNQFNEGKYVSGSYLITNNNINQCIININSINKNLDISTNDKAQKLIDYYIQNIIVPDKKFISHNITFTFAIGLHDRIRYISENFLTDNNINNKDKYKNQILFNAKHFWNYINLYVDSEPLLKTDFFKSIIIKIFSCCMHIYYYNNDFNKIINSISQFDNLSNKLNINENTPSYELVYKVKGDYYFKKNDYKSSINCYHNSIKIMNDKNPKKPAIFFNLGVLYYYSGDNNSSIDYFGKAAEYFKKVEEEKSTFEFHKRNNMLSKKYNLAQYIIKKIKNN
jgi:tetratricopeptide (TPR) repeat protein